jgi:hypothetical protein
MLLIVVKLFNVVEIDESRLLAEEECYIRFGSVTPIPTVNLYVPLMEDILDEDTVKR